MRFTRITLRKLALTLLIAVVSGTGFAADNVGFVYVSPIGDAGWTYQHDLGRLQLEKETGVTTAMVFVMVALASVFFLIVDKLISLGVQYILGIGG